MRLEGKVAVVTGVASGMDESSFVNGAVLAADGGWTAGF